METGIIVNSSLRHWWMFLIRGLIFILVGIYMLCSPTTGFIALGFTFGLIIFVAGISELLHVYHTDARRNRGWHLMLGILDLILGVILMSHIAASLNILRIIIGIWFLLRGISLFAFSGLVRKSWVLALGGFIAMVFGMAVLFNPVFGSITLVFWAALAFIIIGLFNVIQAFWLKKAA